MGQKSYLKGGLTKNVPKMGQKGGQKGSRSTGVVNVKGKSLELKVTRYDSLETAVRRGD